MNILENYEKALQAIYDHVGFVEDCVVYPIDIRDDMFWKIVDNEEVLYAETKELFDDEDGDTYSDEIYTQRFYNKHVYRGEKYTLIFVDTHTDGNKFFAIYDNDKEIKEEVK